MAFIELTQQEVRLRKEEEKLEREAIARAADAAREQELRLAKLKYATQPRYRSIERGVVVLAKAPALFVGVIVIGVLAARGKEIPEVLVKFMTV